LVAPFENQWADLVVERFRPRMHLVVDPEIRGGYPVVGGTRVDFNLVASLMRDGIDPTDVQDFLSLGLAPGCRRRGRFRRRSRSVPLWWARSCVKILLDENVPIQTLDRLSRMLRGSFASTPSGRFEASGRGATLRTVLCWGRSQLRPSRHAKVRL
jgi:hypothetical protein